MKRIGFFSLSLVLGLTTAFPALAQDADVERERTTYTETRTTRTETRSERRDGEVPPPEVAVFGSLYDGRDDPGWGAGAKLNMPVHEHLGIELRSAWIGDISSPRAPRGFDVDAVPVDLGVNVPLTHALFGDEAWITPFLAGGATWMFVFPDGGYEDEDEIGWYAGGGVRVGEERGLGTILEVLYRGVDIDYEGKGSNRSFDSNLDGLTANLGLTYAW